jgi:hypothetical protein
MAVALVDQPDSRWPGPQLLGEILPAVLAKLGLSAVDGNLTGELIFGPSKKSEAGAVNQETTQ